MLRSPKDEVASYVERGYLEYPCCGMGALGPAAKPGYRFRHCGKTFELVEEDRKLSLREVTGP